MLDEIHSAKLKYLINILIYFTSMDNSLYNSKCAYTPHNTKELFGNKLNNLDAG